MNWLEDAKASYVQQDRNVEKMRATVRIESDEAISLIHEGTRILAVGRKYHGSPVRVLTAALQMPNQINTVSIMGNDPVPWQDICSLNLAGIKRLAVLLDGNPTGARLIAPDLEELCIYGRLLLSPMDLLAMPTPHIDFSGTPNLHRLELRHIQQVDPSDFSRLDKLKRLYISDAAFADLEWLSSAAYRLESLTIDGALDACSGIEHQDELCVVDLLHGYIRDVTPIEQLPRLKQLDLRGNDIQNEGTLRSMGLEKLIITKKDVEMQGVRRAVSELIDTAVMQLRRQNQEAVQEKPTLSQDFARRMMKLPFEDRIRGLIQIGYRNKLRELQEAPKIGYGIQMPKDEFIAHFVRLATEYCPFLTMSGSNK